MKTEIPRNATEQGKGGVLVPFCLIILANEMGLYLLFFPVLRYRKDTGETPVSEERGWSYKDNSHQLSSESI